MRDLEREARGRGLMVMSSWIFSDMTTVDETLDSMGTEEMEDFLERVSEMRGYLMAAVYQRNGMA